MSSATMSLIGLNDYDPTLFENLTFPPGINKDIAVDEILMRSGEFEILYPDPKFLKLAIEHWGKKHYRTFEKWVEGLSKEFEPLYNFDRFEEYTDSKTAQGSTTANSKSSDNTVDTADNKSVNNAVDNMSGKEEKEEKANSSSQTSTNSSSSETDTRSVSAYDSSTYRPREQEIKSNTSSQSGNGAAQNENTSETKNNSSNTHSDEQRQTANRTINNSALNEQNATSNNTEQITHTAHLFGNIGVTTSTQLLEDFLRVERFCIYEQIADIFVDEFCIMLY